MLTEDEMEMLLDRHDMDMRRYRTMAWDEQMQPSPERDEREKELEELHRRCEELRSMAGAELTGEGKCPADLSRVLGRSEQK